MSISFVWFWWCLAWILFGLVWFVEAALSVGRMTNFHQFADKHSLGNALIGQFWEKPDSVNFPSVFKTKLSLVWLGGVSIMWLLIIDRPVCCTNWDYWPENEKPNGALIRTGTGYLILVWNFCNGYQEQLPCMGGCMAAKYIERNTFAMGKNWVSRAAAMGDI